MYLRKRTSYCIFAALLLILGPTSGLFAKNAKKVEAPSTKITNSSQVDAATHDINNGGSRTAMPLSIGAPGSRAQPKTHSMTSVFSAHLSATPPNITS